MENSFIPKLVRGITFSNMKFLIVLSAVLALALAGSESESGRYKRGILGIPTAVSYSSQVIHHTPSIPVAYAPVVKYVAPVAPVAAVKVIQPYPIAKVLSPAVSYTKVAYPAPVLPYYGYGFSHFH